jgi:predicted Zn-dependent protease
MAMISQTSNPECAMAALRPPRPSANTIPSWWSGDLRWARNRVTMASDRRDIQVLIRRVVDGGLSFSSTNQLDDVSLESVVRAAERTALLNATRGLPSDRIETPPLPVPNPTIWSDSTYNVTVEQRGALARVLLEEAEENSMLSAGYIEMRAGEVATLGEWEGYPKDSVRYDQFTRAQCSMTVRHPKGIGSGWAGLSSFDWSAIDGSALAKRALDKCLASLNPVAIEPGRYTVVLEPQAVYVLAARLFEGRRYPEMGQGAFTLGPDRALNLWRTKLGLKVLDERITISHDPEDPLLGVPPVPGQTPVVWIERGVLKAMAYDRRYSVETLREHIPSLPRDAFRMTGGESSIEEMISTTKRGLLVTRFSNLKELDYQSRLYTGLTRDGLWLIEGGKISKAVKNMRFTESPLFVFNQVEQLGVPVPVFTEGGDPNPAIVPPVKSRDFSFTSMVDAV